MTKNESGRSMVEMLGVLAIIGVLSVGGIAGYTMAMRSHDANEAANGIAMLAVAAQTAATAPTDEVPLTYRDAFNAASNPSGIDSSSTAATDKSYLKATSRTSITARLKSNEVCAATRDKLSGSATLRPSTCSGQVLTVTIS